MPISPTAAPGLASSVRTSASRQPGPALPQSHGCNPKLGCAQGKRRDSSATRGQSDSDVPFTTIAPTPALRKTRTDYFGNELCFFSIQEQHKTLEIVTKSLVTVQPRETIAVEDSLPWEEVAALFRDPVSPEVVEPYEFVFDSPQIRASQELAVYALECFTEGVPVLDMVEAKRLGGCWMRGSCVEILAWPLPYHP